MTCDLEVTGRCGSRSFWLFIGFVPSVIAQSAVSNPARVQAPDKLKPRPRPSPAQLGRWRSAAKRRKPECAGNRPPIDSRHPLAVPRLRRVPGPLSRSSRPSGIPRGSGSSVHQAAMPPGLPPPAALPSTRLASLDLAAGGREAATAIWPPSQPRRARLPLFFLFFPIPSFLFPVSFSFFLSFFPFSFYAPRAGQPMTSRFTEIPDPSRPSRAMAGAGRPDMDPGIAAALARHTLVTTAIRPPGEPEGREHTEYPHSW